MRNAQRVERKLSCLSKLRRDAEFTKHALRLRCARRDVVTMPDYDKDFLPLPAFPDSSNQDRIDRLPARAGNG